MGVDGVDHIGPYRVVERLGVGGMGEVYKAYDDRLERWVAIKRIRPDKEEAEEHRERFRREARAAAKLNHTAIVHVYDIFHDGDSDCIVMELVEGRSLDQLIAEGPLDPYRAAELARQIAAGLAEAHDKRILHRDLKAENIIVTESEQSKILDFGLAKPLIKGDLDTSLTGKGQVVGTSRAMSPEYVSGDEVDLRSDLFALGVLLYEAVTGQSPFKAHNTLATLKRVILHRQTPAHEVNPEVPLPLSLLIDRLLEKEPEDRPQDAREVAEALGRIVGRSSSSDAHASLTSMTGSLDLSGIDSPAAARRWRWLAFSLLALLVIAVVAGVWMRPDQIDFESQDWIVVGDFVNNTSESNLDNTLDGAFRKALEQSRYAKILPPRQVLSTLKRMSEDSDAHIDRRLGVEICKRESAKALILGQIDKIGTGYRITAEIVEPQGGRTLLAIHEDVRDRNGILSGIDRVTADVRAELGEALSRIEATPPLAKVTTSDFEALRAYSEGVHHFNRDLYDRAISLLEHAVSLDSEFATAHAVLGTAYRNSGNPQKMAQHLRKALEHTERLSPAERLYVEGAVATWLGDDPRQMLNKWQAMVELYPERADGLHNLGMVKWSYFNEFADAVTFLGRAVETTKGSVPRYVASYAYSLIALDRYQDAITELERLANVDDEGSADLRSFVISRLAEAYVAAREYDTTIELLDQLTTPTSEQGLFFLYLDRGQLRRGVETAGENRRQNVESLDEFEVLMALLAGLEIRGPREIFLDELGRAVTQARQYADSGLQDRVPIPSVPLLSVLGKLSARHGALDQADSIQTRVDVLTSDTALDLWGAYAKMLEGEILSARGDGPAAISAFRGSLALVETIQARESLARELERAGQTGDAIEEYGWLAAHRGRAFVECLGYCSERPINVLHWALALDHLGRLYELHGDREEALDFTQRFLDQWRDGDPDLDVLRQAKARLERLRQAP